MPIFYSSVSHTMVSARPLPIQPNTTTGTQQKNRGRNSRPAANFLITLIAPFDADTEVWVSTMSTEGRGYGFLCCFCVHKQGEYTMRQSAGERFFVAHLSHFIFIQGVGLVFCATFAPTLRPSEYNEYKRAGDAFFVSLLCPLCGHLRKTASESRNSPPSFLYALCFAFLRPFRPLFSWSGK